MMRKALLSLLLAAAATLQAQSLRLDVGLPCESYVLNETVPLTLRIANNGATPFIVDDYGDYLENSVSIVLRHEADGFQESSSKGMPFGPLMVTPQQAHTVTCNLNEWFSLLRQGKYSVQVFAKRGGETFASRLVVFSIVKGLEISTVSHMLPNSDTRGRRYTLLYWPRKQREDLFLRVEEEPSDNVSALFNLGPVVRYVKPTLKFGKDGQVSLVHQIGPDRYVQTIFQSDASTLKVVEQRQLVDPSQAVLSRSVLENRERERALGEALPEFRRRTRPESAGNAASKDAE